MPRRSKFSRVLQERITEALEMGCSRRCAYGQAHISADTFYSWLRNKPAFSDAVCAAEAHAEAHWLEMAKDDARSQDWIRLLSLRFKTDWAERVQVQGVEEVSVTYVNDWREAADASFGPEDSAPAGEAVQLAGDRPAVAEDNAVPEHSD